MASDRLARLGPLHEELLKISQRWAARRAYSPDRARELRRETILLNHAHYRKRIRAYRELAEEEGVTDLTEIGPILTRLMSTDDIFKSYRQAWLDDRDFPRMNRWLESLYDRPIEADVSDVTTIDEWIDRLTATELTPVYSSGTSGAFSFVPRDARGWQLFTSAPVSYLTPLLMERKLVPLFKRLLIVAVTRLISSDRFARWMRRVGLPDYDGILLNFRKGNMGIQLVGQELSGLFRNAYFLYEIDLMASALRCIARGPKNDEDRRLLERFHAETVGKKEENYARIADQIASSTRAGQKVFLFGAPYQLKELCELIASRGERIPLRKRSFILFGGGWKSFEGERISREDLVGILTDLFAVPGESIVEGYSMTEMNALMPRCDQGRFHVPPMLEPAVFDEALLPLEGSDQTGAFGFLDPFAVSYPGFIISGDNVRLVYEPCPCGLAGPAILDIARAPGREVKGCGGIMASVQA